MTDGGGDATLPPDASEETDGSAFAYFSLEGDRFDAIGLPATTAREVGHFREAVMAMARALYLDRNPDRSRVPAGFEEGFDLRLTEVQPGSARPKLVLNRPRSGPGSSPSWDEWAVLYADARDMVADTLGIMAVRRTVPTGLSSATRVALKRVGSALREDERLAMGNPTSVERRAIVDAGVRQVLARINDDLDDPPAPEIVTATGVITEYDGGTLSFRLRTEAGVAKCVLEHFNPTLAERVRGLLALDGVTAPDVEVEGETLEPNRRPLHIFNVHSVQIVREWGEKVLAERLHDLRRLEDGWWGPESLAPDADVLERLELVVNRLAALGEHVELTPRTDGSVFIEWRRGDVEMSAAVEPEGQLFLCADNTVTDELMEAQIGYDRDVLLRFLEGGQLP